MFDHQLPAAFRKLPFDRYLSVQNVKKVVSEADGYQPHLIAPEQGYRRLIEASLAYFRGPAEATVNAVIGYFPWLTVVLLVKSYFLSKPFQFGNRLIMTLTCDTTSFFNDHQRGHFMLYFLYAALIWPKCWPKCWHSVLGEIYWPPVI